MAIAAIFVACAGYGIVRWSVVSNAGESVTKAENALDGRDTLKARESLKWLLWFKPLHPEALYVIGKCDQADGDLTKAIESYERSVNSFRIQSSHSRLYKKASLSLGTALFRDQQIDRAEHSLRRHLEMFPRSSKASEILEGILLSQARNNEVIELLQRRRQLLPDNESLLFEILNAAQSRDASEVLRYATEVNKARPGQPSVLATIGYAHWQLGDFENSRQYMNQAIDIGNMSPFVRIRAADFLAFDGDAVEATSLLTPLVDVFSEELYWRVRGRIAEKQAEFEQALQFVEKSLAANPFDRETLSSKARLCQRLGRRKEAEELHKRISELAKAYNELDNLASELSDTIPTAQEARRISELYAAIGRKELAKAWKNLKQVSPSGEDE